MQSPKVQAHRANPHSSLVATTGVPFGSHRCPAQDVGGSPSRAIQREAFRGIVAFAALDIRRVQRQSAQNLRAHRAYTGNVARALRTEARNGRTPRRLHVASPIDRYEVLPQTRFAEPGVKRGKCVLEMIRCEGCPEGKCEKIGRKCCQGEENCVKC